MAQGVAPDSTGNSGTWTSAQAYILAVVCLLVGVAAGYLLRGSGSSAAVPAAQPVQGSTAQGTGAVPQGMGGGAQPSPEQMKAMADQQAAPLLAQMKSKPNDPALLANIGNVYYDAQQFKDATNYYERSLKADPKNFDVRTDMATAYFYAGDADHAIAEFNTVLKDDPKHAQTLFNLGMVKWEGKGDANGAIQTWEKLLQENPNYPDRERVEQAISRAKQHSNMAPGTTTNKPATM